MALLFVVAFATVLAVGNCGNLTVTQEATISVEIKNYDGEGEDFRGKFTIGLFGETVPMTTLNFGGICKGFKRGNKGPKLHYKNTFCHRVVKDMLVQCGDVTIGDGSGSKSIYGDKFNDENFAISHSSAGVVSMANHGQDTNGSQFFILFTRARYLDGKHVAFGKILRGFDVVDAINDLGAEKDGLTPKRPIKITDCSIEDVEKYDLSRKQMFTDDIEK